MSGIRLSAATYAALDESELQERRAAFVAWRARAEAVNQSTWMADTHIRLIDHAITRLTRTTR